ncbi:hypothetical protein [Cytobacillus sp. NCCP-133]|uniref:hypothetical protein n=1 Tax=Cytobacillus sp. NCCP-133 TaxID=766848 RepID=UPI00222EFF3B|nr:hypothetical protein [Cytobacillus sp. NCCP-133]GLB58666.1 hypothetical protein NCCP133_07990 [Cytobacillus sp. NCCP-133]
MAKKKETYKDHLNKTVAEILAMERRKRRLPAMAVYLNNFDMSVQDVAELLDIPEGTAKDWSSKDEWHKTREEIKENIKNKMKVSAETEHVQLYGIILSNLLHKFMEASMNPNVKVMDIRDMKFLAEALEKNYKILGLLNVIEEPVQKVEHSGEVTQNHNVSEYERKLDKFNSMLGIISKPKDGEENGE